ncbi:kinesin-like protein KIN-UC [Tanacetum coccineum]
MKFEQLEHTQILWKLQPTSVEMKINFIRAIAQESYVRTAPGTIEQPVEVKSERVTRIVGVQREEEEPILQDQSTIFVLSDPFHYLIGNIRFTYSYCFKARISDGTATICFSPEAHRLTQECNTLVATLEDKNPYSLPPSLASLEGTRRIFQFRFTKVSQHGRAQFILDKIFDPTPLAILPPDNVTAESPTTDIGTSAVPTDTKQPHLQVSTPATEHHIEKTVKQSESNISPKKTAKRHLTFEVSPTKLADAGHKKGRSLLMDDGVLTWLLANLNIASISTRRHIELALCHLAQNEDNTRDFVTSGVKELAKISVESSRDDIRDLAKKILRLNRSFKAELQLE